ncbi:MAG TPA: ADOP family duplicated permease [Gemmatimonadaceae bacterium]
MTHPADDSPRWRSFLFWRRNVQRDVDAELQFHFHSRIAELVAQGVSPDEARRRTIEEFGDVGEVRRDLNEIDARIARRERRSDRLEAWWRDLTYAARSLRRTPGVTITIILTLALGLGVNAAMFSLLDLIFLRPPVGVEAPDDVRRLWTEIRFRSGPQYWPGYDYMQYEAVRDGLAGIGTTAIYRQEALRLGRGARAERVNAVYTSADYFRLLGVHPALGRFFSTDEDRLGAGLKVAVVSHDFWQRRLDATPDVIGRSLVLENEVYTIIGVTAPGFRGVDLDAADLWVPLGSMVGYGVWWTRSSVNGFSILIRRNAGVSLAQIDQQATLALRRRAAEDPVIDSNTVTRTGSINAARGPGQLDQEVQIATRLGGVALIVLVIACANVVNLLLARAVRRRREVAMRLALGISRGRLARMVLTESVLLALAAGIAALAAAHWGALGLRAILLPGVDWAQPPVDWRVAVAALAATAMAGLVAGVIPAVQSGATDLNEVLKSGTREAHVVRSRMRGLLVVLQAALSVVLLIGAALFVRSLANVRALDLGFDTDALLFGTVSFDTRDPQRDSLTHVRMSGVAQRLRGVPGVEETALAHMRPFWGVSFTDYFPESDTIANPKPFGIYWAVSPEYFRTAGTRIVAGTSFPPGGTGAPPAVIVNTAMAAALWPGEDPLGRCIRFGEPGARCYRVVGVAETARWQDVIEDAAPQFYLPIENMPFPILTRPVVAVRTSPAHAPTVIRAMGEALAEGLPGGIPQVERMSTILEPHYRPWRLGATLFTLFGVLAALVAAVGVYSAVSYAVSQRTHEFGVRVALGAQVGHVVRQVLGNGLRSVVIGIVAGVSLALAAGRLVASLLYGVAPNDPVTIALVVALLLAVATLAALVPAWRAARVDPVTALRTE